MRKLNHVVYASFMVLFLNGNSLYSMIDNDIALMLKTKGRVEFNKEGRRTWSLARRGLRLDSGEKIRTGDNSLAALVFTDDRSQLKIRSNSSVTIKGKREKKGIVKRITLGFGQLWAKVTRQKSEMRVETPSGVATVKGTEFYALFVDGLFVIYCVEGLVELFNQAGLVVVGAGEVAQTDGGPPTRIDVDPNSIFDLSDDEGGSILRFDFENENNELKSLILEFE